MSRAFRWDLDVLALFWRFIYERQLAFYRRKVLNKPPPWSTDPVIKDQHFTNIYRELDPGTSWVRERVLEQDVLPAGERAFLVFAYRLFGTEAVFEHLGVHLAGSDAVGRDWPQGHPMLPGTFDQRWLADQLQELMDSGKQAFTPAYMVSNYGMSEPKPVVISRVLARAAVDWDDTWMRCEAASSRQEAFVALSRVYGMGNFVAFQTLVDLCYPLRTSHGQGLLRGHSNNGWVRAGPGAMRGLQLLLPGARQADDDPAIAELVRLQREPLDQLGMPWLLDPKNRPVLIDRSNMQNCLCEFSKYEGSGGRRRSFDPATSHTRDTTEPPKPGQPATTFGVQVDAFTE
jgi:hypothetical protein